MSLVWHMTILQENYKRDITNQQLATTKRNHYFELGLDIKPFDIRFYEPRILVGYLEVPKKHKWLFRC
jgi:hypothetical protein